MYNSHFTCSSLHCTCAVRIYPFIASNALVRANMVKVGKVENLIQFPENLHSTIFVNNLFEKLKIPDKQIHWYNLNDDYP